MRACMHACRLMAEDAVDAAIEAGALKPERGCVTDRLRLVGTEGYSSSLFAHLAQVCRHKCLVSASCTSSLNVTCLSVLAQELAIFMQMPPWASRASHRRCQLEHYIAVSHQRVSNVSPENVLQEFRHRVLCAGIQGASQDRSHQHRHCPAPHRCIR